MTTMALLSSSADPLRDISMGFGEPARLVRERTADARRHARDNASDWRTLAASLVRQLYQDSQSIDEEQGKPVSAEAASEALRFIDALPAELPMPEVALDPDGEISFDWWFAPNAQLSISVGPSGELSYAGLIGKGVKRHGIEPMGSVVPPLVLETLRELVTRFAPRRPR